MKRGLARFWYRFKNWFRTKPGPGEPLTFLCGSEEELRRVTAWICHIHPQMYPNDSAIIISYISSTRRTRGGYRLLSFGEFPSDTQYKELSLIQMTCTIVFEYNKFTGTKWVNGLSGEQTTMPEMMVSPGHIGLSIFTKIYKIYEKPIYLEVITKAPSAHERAEALLSLSEWLDGKVSEEEKRELLGLCD